MERKFGILMPVFSLRSKYGTGTFGKCAYDFVDFLARSGVGVWQVLPLCPIGAGASPYSSPAVGYVDPMYIDPEILAEKGMLGEKDRAACEMPETQYIDFKTLRNKKMSMLKKAFKRFDGSLCQTEYAVFEAISHLERKPWSKWSTCCEYGCAETAEFIAGHKDEIDFYQFMLDEAEDEWNSLKRYANERNIEIMGDMPFYVDGNSVDVWLNRALFEYDGTVPKLVAGVPPDYFSESGQLWGNPVYDWHNKQTFEYFRSKISKALKRYDILRLDHFRAFDEFYAVPYGSKDAANGKWFEGPGIELFEGLTDKKIVAEDLGIITHSVKRLVGRTGFPGMNVLQFGFDGNEQNPHLPSNIGYNRVCYTGTHDNTTLVDFVENADRDMLDAIIKNEGGRAGGDALETAGEIIELGCATDARLFVVPLFDLMFKGREYRINTPSTVSARNWSVRLVEDHSYLSDFICALTKRYNRQNKLTER